MKDNDFKKIVNKIFLQIFDKIGNYELEDIKHKFAYSINLPKEVHDFTTNEITWSYSNSGFKFITQNNMSIKDNQEGWMKPKVNLTKLSDILEIWQNINLLTTERVYESLDVFKSDTIYASKEVYNCADCRDCKDIIFCESCGNCEYILASKRSSNCFYCINVEDSKNCNNSFQIVCSNKVHNSLFIQDCFNLFECMFCAHIANKQYCIANMQFEKEEYYKIKKLVIDWIINS